MQTFKKGLDEGEAIQHIQISKKVWVREGTAIHNVQHGSFFVTLLLLTLYYSSIVTSILLTSFSGGPTTPPLKSIYAILSIDTIDAY